MMFKQKLAQLRTAYPDHIANTSSTDIIWQDGSQLAIGTPTPTLQEALENPSLADQLLQAEYPAGPLSHEALSISKIDPGRIRNTQFFGKIYGDSPEKVTNNLTTIPWMPEIYSDKFLIQITTINQVDQKLIAVSSELSTLSSEYYRFCHSPHAFLWRNIAGTQRLSPHSLGIAIDIGAEHTHYWQWDLQKAGKPVSETTPVMPFQNRIPWEIILIFEKYGFIWGGKWHHYDTMHFEYRPELLITEVSVAG